MNNFRLGVFEVFSYITPGLFYMLLIPLSMNILGKSRLINDIFINKDIPFYSIFALFFVAYLIGFLFDWFAYKYYQLIFGKSHKNKVIKHFNNENPDSKITDYNFGYIYAYAEVHCPNSREKADQFSALSNMSRNLSFCFY